MINLTFQIMQEAKPRQNEDIFYIDRKGYFGQGKACLHWELVGGGIGEEYLDYVDGDTAPEGYAIVGHIEDDLLDDGVLWISIATLRLMIDATAPRVNLDAP